MEMFIDFELKLKKLLPRITRISTNKKFVTQIYSMQNIMWRNIVSIKNDLRESSEKKLLDFTPTPPEGRDKYSEGEGG